MLLVYLISLLSSQEPVVQNEMVTAIPSTSSASASPLPFITLTLDSVFDEYIENSGPSAWTLVVGGDYNPGRHVNMVATQQNSFGFQLANLTELFRRADIALLNLEGALVRDCPLVSEGMKFCGDIRHIESLVGAGIDAVSLANNHSLNYGQNGLDETKSYLRLSSLASAGFDETMLLPVRDQFKVAIIGIDTTLQERSRQDITDLVRAAHQQSPIVIPYFHWGSEYTHDPTPAQRELAHSAIEAGAALVLGSHPHWVQGVEIIGNKLVVYSHGNLVFDQFWSEKTRQGIVGEYYFQGEKLVDARFRPIYLGEGYKPYLVQGESAEAVLSQMQQASERL